MAKRSQTGYIVPFQWSGGGHDAKVFSNESDANSFATKKHRGKKVTGIPKRGTVDYW